MTTDDPLARWQEQLRRGGLDLAILLAISSAPRYGLAIIEYLRSTTDLVVTEGTIYPILGRLTRNGVVEAEWISDEAPHPRKYYRLTAKGQSVLRAMLDQWSTYRDKLDRLVETTRGRQI